ncbi:MAG: trigger factor [Bdellovibrionales bacterium]|nr:trigger factor [Bdellovibrionales bacterium]
MSIESSIEEVDEVTRKFTVTIPSKMVTAEFETALSSVAKTAKIKGFRPGKAPLAMVKKLHGSRIHMEVASRMISNTLGDLVKEHELSMIGSPEIDVANLKEGENISYSASVSLYPSPKIKNYEKFEIEVPKEEVSEDEIDQVVDRLRQSKATSKPVEGRELVGATDVIEGTLAIQLENEETAPAEPIIVALGEGQLPKELEEGIPGIKLGEEKEIAGSIPLDHPNAEVRGKPAVFKVIINSISEKVLPELDDEFAKSLGIEAETMPELRAKIRERLEQEAEKEQKAATQTAVLDQLLEKNDFLVPQVLVDEEIKHFLVRAGAVDSSKVKLEDIDPTPFRDQLGSISEKRVKATVMVDQIAKQESFEVSDADFDKYFGEFAEQSNVGVEEVKKFFQDKWRKRELEAEIKRSKVNELLVSRAKIKFLSKEEALAKKEKAEKAESEKSKKSKTKDSESKASDKKGSAKKAKKESS